MLAEATGAGVERSLAAAAVAVKGDASRHTSMALVNRPKLNPRRRIPTPTPPRTATAAWWDIPNAREAMVALRIAAYYGWGRAWWARRVRRASTLDAGEKS
jgi:hypothetical protein